MVSFFFLVSIFFRNFDTVNFLIQYQYLVSYFFWYHILFFNFNKILFQFNIGIWYHVIFFLYHNFDKDFCLLNISIWYRVTNLSLVNTLGHRRLIHKHCTCLDRLSPSSRLMKHRLCRKPCNCSNLDSHSLELLTIQSSWWDRI